ncbi:hypothetical protein GCM10018773_25880 [Streptomyces candidus]|nr:hypothetical protein GCM10018773_25880 [Streptomyces candidus]
MPDRADRSEGCPVRAEARCSRWWCQLARRPSRAGASRSRTSLVRHRTVADGPSGSRWNRTGVAGFGRAVRERGDRRRHGQQTGPVAYGTLPGRAVGARAWAHTPAYECLPVMKMFTP